MQVNITLAFQAVQFMVSYYFLYNYLFVPAYALLTKDEKVQQDLQTKIKNKESEIQSLEDKNKKRFASLKEKLFGFIPKLSGGQIVFDKSVRSSSRAIQETSMSEAEKQKTKAFLVDALSEVKK